MESQAALNGMFPSLPQPDLTSLPQGSMVIQSYQSKASLQKFLRGEPKALGTVQIMIALMNLILGAMIVFISQNPYGQRLFLWYTGYVFWGSAFFIISGSLSIAAENRITNTLVQSSLAMNAVSSVVAGLGIIFFAVTLISFNITNYFCSRADFFDTCFFGDSLLLGCNIFLLILTVLELAISLTISSIGCRAVCCVQRGVTFFMPPPIYVPQNSAAEANKGGTTLQSSVADTTSLPASHPNSSI
ncbi:membrane-spanning 4-domains subfamily A member 4A-like [Dromiciops gliroides]|uniref:membrane-spanning 4-domains subfamily A member 4A-like n=1 Tax=Dromiciops gliroides TaxID=33562 RepID=UPI001CC77BD5|nr:membrane-spanning 4-domains subfamily A member 4A-like [Dromiciops gliroides]